MTISTIARAGLAGLAIVAGLMLAPIPASADGWGGRPWFGPSQQNRGASPHGPGPGWGSERGNWNRGGDWDGRWYGGPRPSNRLTQGEIYRMREARDRYALMRDRGLADDGRLDRHERNRLENFQDRQRQQAWRFWNNDRRRD